jgi:hypothetical protein
LSENRLNKGHASDQAKHAQAGQGFGQKAHEGVLLVE